MGKKEFLKKLVDFDKKYLKLKYLLLGGVILGVILGVISVFSTSTELFMDSFKRYFKFAIIPLLQFVIVGICIYFLIRGGYKTVITKDVKKYGKESVEHSLKQASLFSVLVPGSGQLLLGYTKRGIIIFLISLFLEVNIFILLPKTLEFFFPLLIAFLFLTALWIWNIRDAYKIASKIKIVSTE